MRKRRKAKGGFATREEVCARAVRTIFGQDAVVVHVAPEFRSTRLGPLEWLRVEVRHDGSYELVARSAPAAPSSKIEVEVIGDSSGLHAALLEAADKVAVRR